MDIRNMTAWVSACYLLIPLLLTSEARLWTDIQGRTIDGELESATAKDVTVVLKSGKKVVIPLARLSSGDRFYVAVMREEMAKGTPPPGEANKKPADKPAETTDPVALPADPKGALVFPETLRYPGETTVKTLDDPDGRNAYASENVRIYSEVELKPDGLDELVLLLESGVMYWRLLGLPPGRGEDSSVIELVLCTEDETYIKNGGPETAPGFCRGSDNAIVISATRSDLKVRAGRIKIGEMPLPTVILHELVHQQTPRSYRGPTPDDSHVWMIEGLAEYIRSTPYDKEKGFDLTKRMDHVVAMVSRPGTANGIVGRNLGRTIELPKLADFTTIGLEYFSPGENEEFRKRSCICYSLSCMMVAHFLHTDRNGDMTRFRKLTNALVSGATKDESMEVFLDGDNWEKLEEEITAGFDKVGLKLKFGAVTMEQFSSLQ